MRILIDGNWVDLAELIEREEKEVKEIKAVKLGGTELSTQILVLIRTQEQPHYHASHDLLITLLKGKGELYLDGKKYPLKTGDSVLIPAGKVHYYTNTSIVSAILATFSPAYDGKDSIKVEEVK